MQLIKNYVRYHHRVIWCTENFFWIRLSGKVNNIISTRVRIYNFHLIWNLFFIYNQLMWHNVNPIYRKYFYGTIHINKRKPGSRFKPNNTIQSDFIIKSLLLLKFLRNFWVLYYIEITECVKYYMSSVGFELMILSSTVESFTTRPNVNLI